MYSSKEKIAHLRKLLNPDAANADLSLLKKLDSTNGEMARFENAPKRNAESILFALLDVASHEEIVAHRRQVILSAQETGEDVGKEAGKDTGKKTSKKVNKKTNKKVEKKSE